MANEFDRGGIETSRLAAWGRYVWWSNINNIFTVYFFFGPISEFVDFLGVSVLGIGIKFKNYFVVLVENILPKLVFFWSVVFSELGNIVREREIWVFLKATDHEKEGKQAIKGAHFFRLEDIL